MNAMARLDLEYVQRFKDRHGKLRHYFRRPGFKRVTLPGQVGSAEFMDAYQTALASTRRQAGIERTKPYTLGALIVAYYETARYQQLAADTRRTYSNMLDRFREKYGQLSAVHITTSQLDVIFNGMADTPGAAKNLRKRLGKVFTLAIKLDWRRDNPIAATDAPEWTGEGFIPWTEADIAQFEKRWPAGSRERRALYLLLYTGVRRSDLVSLGRQHRMGGKIKVKVYKGRKRHPTELTIPVHPGLAAELALAPATDLTYVVTQYGAPFTMGGFTQWFVERARMAGLENRTPHGLRKAAARRLAEAGCTTKEIAAITGHRTLSEVEEYTRSADQAKLAGAAMGKLAGRKVNRSGQT